MASSSTSTSTENAPSKTNWNIHASSFRPSYMDNDLDTDVAGSSNRLDAEYDIVRDDIPSLSQGENAHFELLRDLEKSQHEFAQFYKEEKEPMNRNLQFLSSLVGAYSHQHAIEFIAKSRVWMHRSPPSESLPSAPETADAVREFDDVTGTHALYRVLTEKVGKYILVACHFNVHGLRRGDLRFIEVNGRTKTDGSSYSCIGHLVVGDIVGVTELSKTSFMPSGFKDVDVASVTQETPCVWMAKSLVLMRRKRFSEIPFSFIQNGTVISPAFGKALTIKQKVGFVLADAKNKIFIGSGIIPQRINSEFAGELHAAEWRELQFLTSTVAKYPDAVGVVTEYKLDEFLTSQFDKGTRAFYLATEESEDIVELCVLMGQSAVHVILSDGFDSRSFEMTAPKKEGELVKFSIPNTENQMTEVLWRNQTKILIGSSKLVASAVIETTIIEEDQLNITARLSNIDIGFEFTDKIHIVQQKVNHSQRPLERGFFKKLPLDSNGRIAIETLYGGPPLIEEIYDEPEKFYFASTSPFELNEYQNEYINLVLNGTALTVATAPFGCGKSVTIAVAAIYSLMETRKKGIYSQNLLITQSNYASVNLVDIISQFKFKHSDARIVRFIREDDWNDLPETSRTPFDLPNHLAIFFTEFAIGTLNSDNVEDLTQMVLFLTDRGLINIDDMTPEAQSLYYKHCNEYTVRYSFAKFTYLFFKILEPEIIVATADTLPDLLHELKDVSTVQFDEVSQVPESTLITLFSRVPNACFGLVGDIHQLTPFCTDTLCGHLKKYGIGRTMERTVTENLFPTAVLQLVYRCHPVTTAILGEMFYDYPLISGVTEDDRNQFMKSRPDIWPNYHFPIMVLNNESQAKKMGTSLANDQEIWIVKDLVCKLMESYNGYSLKPIEVGVISFYKAQESLLTESLRGTQIKCGTVDSFQGSEREVMIVCCTSEYVSKFVANKNRINVAMSRAKQATIVIGNAHGLFGDPHWRTFVQKSREHGCYKDMI